MEAGPGGFCANEGIAQVVFLEADEICYTDQRWQVPRAAREHLAEDLMRIARR
jgi:hypothetical protein